MKKWLSAYKLPQLPLGPSVLAMSLVWENTWMQWVLLYCLLELFWLKKISNKKVAVVAEIPMRSFLPYTVYIVISVLGVLYTQESDQAWFNIQQRISMLLIPFALFAYRPYLQTKRVNKHYVLGVVFMCLVLLLVAFIRFLENHSGREFYYTSLSIFNHTTYVGFLVWIALLMLVFNKVRLKRQARNGIACFLFFILYLFTSRAILFLGIILLVYWGYIEFRKSRFKSFLTGSAILMLAIFVAELQVGYLADRNIEMRVINEGKAQQETTSSGSRLQLWSAAKERILAHPILGYGTGSSVVEQENGSKLNAHNQYLESVLENGIFGICALLYLLFAPVISGIKRKQLLIVLVMAGFAWVMLTESIFMRITGIATFAYFSYYFQYFLNKKDDTIFPASNR